MKKIGEGGPEVTRWDNLPSPVGIGLTDLPNMGGGQWPPWPSRFRHHCRIGYLVRGKRLEDMASNGPFLAAEYFVIVFTPLNIASPKKALFATIAKKPDNLKGVSGFAVRSLYDITKG